MTVFYAYIHNIIDDNTSRYVLVFASRAVADEWWRAISTSKSLSAYFTRVSPQFYTHNAKHASVNDFFIHSRFQPISEQFRGKFFMTLLDDRGGRQISIIPPQEITDHICGNWFYIRSKANPNLYWDYTEADGLFVSNDCRTRFQIKARNVPDGAVMIGSDYITVHLTHELVIDIEKSGLLVASKVPREFRFDDLENGRFQPEGDEGVLMYYVDSRKESWVLV